MSLIDAQTPADYDTANLASTWQVVEATLIVDPTNGYGGGPAISGSSLAAYGIQYFTPPGGAFIGMGDRYKVTAFPATETIILAAVDATGTMIVSLTIRPDGKLALYRGHMGSLLLVSPSAVATGSQLRIGFQTTLGAGAGAACEIDVAGLPVVVGTGSDPGAATWGGIYIGAGPTMYHSHFYWKNSSGLQPSLLCDWVPSVNAALADNPPDGDTTVVALAAALDRLTSALDTVTDRVRVYGVHTKTLVKQVTGDGGFAPIITVGGFDYVSDRQAVSDDIYRSCRRFDAVNPQTGVPWLTTQIAATSLGGEART